MTRKNGIRVRNLLVAGGVLFFLLAVVLLIMTFVFKPEEETEVAEVSEPTAPDYKVLFLDSYSPTHVSYPAQERGIKAGLYSNNISYDVIYMDTKNYGSQEEIDAFYAFFRDRLLGSEKEYDGVITGDDAALKFALQHQEELFPGLPIVYYGINNIPLAEEAVQNPLMTGFTEETYLDETFDLAIKLLPKANKIVGIYDNTTTGQGDKETFFGYREQYPGYDFIGINTSEHSLSEYCKILESLGSDCILIYLTAFEDADGNAYSIPESAQIIVDHTHIPVFRNYMGGEGLGIVGGVQMNFPVQCEMAGEVMADVLYGRQKIAEIPLQYDTPGYIIYDYSVMANYGLDTRLIPHGATVINQPVDYWDQYNSILIPAILIIFGLLCMLLAMIINYLMMKRTTEALRRTEDKLVYETEHDMLLGIYNRRVAEEFLNRNIMDGKKQCLLRIDIDDFNLINESYGHAVGDRYLRFVANLLKDYAVANVFLLARHSGDEFLMIIPGRTLSEDSPELHEIHEMMKTPMKLGLEELRTTVSIGVVNTDAQTDVETIFAYSDLSLREAKERGKNRSVIYEEQLQEKVLVVNQTRSILQSVIENRDFYMLYQPKVDVQTKELVGFEALIRIKDRDLSPAFFIPIAEESGLIGQIGRITTEMVIRQLALWRDEGKKLYPVSVNYSSNQINDTGYIDFIRTQLEKYAVDPKYFEIEITEGLFMDNNYQSEQLFKQFRKLGIKLLMDDFGTGYSSLSYLTYIPVDVLKLDRSLVINYLVEGKDAFIRDIVGLAHDLGKQMIIEGVEYEWQYNKLKEFGADVIQGFYFSRPISADEAADWTVKE